MKCHTVQDLLPLYAEQLTSAETAADIAEHLAQCSKCAQTYNDMQPPPAVPLKEPPEIASLKKIRRHSRIAISVTALISAIVGVLTFLFGIYGIIPLKAEDITMEISLYREQIFETGHVRYSYEENADTPADARISIILRGNCVGWRTDIGCNSWWHHRGEPDEIILINENVVLYRNLMPFCKPEVRVGMPLIDGYLITIPTKDEIYTYELTELARLAESQGGTATMTVGSKLNY